MWILISWWVYSYVHMETTVMEYFLWVLNVKWMVSPILEEMSTHIFICRHTKQYLSEMRYQFQILLYIELQSKKNLILRNYIPCQGFSISKVPLNKTFCFNETMVYIATKSIFNVKIKNRYNFFLLLFVVISRH